MNNEYFSVLADEITNVSGIEQFTLCVIFVEYVENQYHVHNEFLNYIPVEDLASPGLANTVINYLAALYVLISIY